MISKKKLRFDNLFLKLMFYRICFAEYVLQNMFCTQNPIKKINRVYNECNYESLKTNKRLIIICVLCLRIRDGKEWIFVEWDEWGVSARIMITNEYNIMRFAPKKASNSSFFSLFIDAILQFRQFLTNFFMT
jgi:hypothetical protein